MLDLVDRLNRALGGRYRIERQLGEGGMATVYLARDLKHNRNVALKVLKPELTAVVGTERFLAEIETTANLQHPHILPLFDSGSADGFLFYVMPYVQGETLRQKLDREHQLPVEEAVQIAENLAEALDHAHSHGVIHRDIKPANILLQAGKPVISDFGIALAVGAAGGGRLTETGFSLGTPHYMSPEQATGDQTVGATTDIYALGCVLYEMLVGEPPYTGSTLQAILGKVITGNLASVREHRRSVPPNVDAAIRKSLERVPADRFRSAPEFARALTNAGFRHGMGVAATGDGAAGSWNRPRVVTTGMALIFVALFVWQFLRPEVPSSPASVARFEAPFRAGQGPVDFDVTFDLSPDGSLLVYVGPGSDPSDASSRQLWVRRWSDLDATPIRGTDAAYRPAISPEGERVAFVQGREIKVMALSGGSAATLAEGIMPRWGPDGYLYFGSRPGGAGPIQRVPATGGPVEVVRPWANGDSRQVVWDVLPGGDVALTLVIREGNADVGLLRIDSGEMTELLPDAWTPRFTTTGHIVFATPDGSLMAVPFDPRSENVGEPVRVMESLIHVGQSVNGFALSQTGTLVTEPARPDAGGELALVWVSRAGDVAPLPLPPARYAYPQVSPDGSHLVAGLSQADGTADLWTYDVGSGATLRLTYDGLSRRGLWLPDGRDIVFSSTWDAPRPASLGPGTWWGNLYVVPSDRSREPSRLSTTDENQFISGVSPDGRTLVYTSMDFTRDQWEIRAVPSDFSVEPHTVVSGPFHSGLGTISPDGRWLAYRSDESRGGRAWDIFVQPFPGPGAKVPVSIGGGDNPVWSRDGGELFYGRPDGMLMAASIAGDEAPRVIGRTPLFSTSGYFFAGSDGGYDVGPDGRFLMMRSFQSDSIDVEALTPKLVVTLNWMDELEARVPH